MATKIMFSTAPFEERQKEVNIASLPDNCLTVVNPGLAAEWHPTKNGELTPDMVTVGSGRKVWWLCKKGHEWQANINHRNQRGDGCPYCSGHKVLYGLNDLATVNSKLASEWHPTLNGNLTPNDVTRCSNKKTWWLGKCGHEWQSAISDRTNGKGCPFCSGRMILVGFNDLSTVSSELASEWHPTLNGDLTPHDVTRSSNKKVWWFGKCGHEWQASVNSRSRGNGCPYCSNKKVLKGYNDLATTNPELASEWHPTLNGGLTPYDVMCGSEKKVWWLGRCGHEWKSAISNRTKGRGCHWCQQELRTSFAEQAIYFYINKSFSDAVNRNISLGKELDIYIPSIKTGIEYDGSLYHNDISRDNRKSLWCKEHGIRLIRVREEKCPKLNGNDIIIRRGENDASLHDVLIQVMHLLGIDDCIVDINKDRADIYEQYIELKKQNSLAYANQMLASEWHPTKNKNLKSDMVASNSDKKVWWLGKCGHEWQASVNSRSRGNRCPYCSNQKVLKGYNDLAVTNPKLASEWHPTLNGNLTPHDVTRCSNKRAWWLGKCGHEWHAVINSRNSGVGCPYCSNKKTLAGYNDLATTNPELASEWHPTRNGDLTLHDVTRSSGKKVWWLGKCGHEWDAKIDNRNNGQGCPYCSGQRVLKGFNDLATTRPELAKEWHPAKNGELTPENVTAGSRKKVWWLCREGHEWPAVISSRNSGCGCPYCSGRKRIVS